MKKNQLKQLIKEQIKKILLQQPIKSDKSAYNTRVMFSAGGGKEFGK